MDWPIWREYFEVQIFDFKHLQIISNLYPGPIEGCSGGAVYRKDNASEFAAKSNASYEVFFMKSTCF